ncbi:MAG: hypothetical protein AW10_03095 [Candidatus Accumulibacter appositus]|uniref:Uncharacterized protein n=1 Tax=Candidatus Accumulibacter appositus TaxID=1454003 RepID=A0A011NSQ4_9PROT|nr:hypothetical protein [Accumulibacter sp.]EXI78381.1 MAG: hypothetical protein AW10_03095 [Candidatus Accumulibacter appositus]HRF06607.1 hypothetical protein [Accumulibacter sp.]
MIYEYALEPSLVVDWALAGDGCCVSQFGLDCRRLVSDFPTDWKGLVFADFLARYDYDYGHPDVANTQPTLDAFLQILTDCMVLRQIHLPQRAAWLEEAINEHFQRPFHAIFARRRPEDSPADVITEENIRNVRDPHWRLPTIKTTRKSAADIASRLRPLLQAASKIFLIDPYFDASKKRFQDPFAEIMRQTAMQPRAVSSSPVISLITGVERHFKETAKPTNEQEIGKRRKEEANVAAEIVRQARCHLAALVPNGLAVKISVLKNPTRGDPLHNRFVLTDVGGVILPYGLDERDRDGQCATDDLTLLPQGMYWERWKQYAEGKGIEVVLGPEDMQGTGR